MEMRRKAFCFTSVCVCVCVCGPLFSFGSVRWAEKELHMMTLFFDNLQHYIQEVREHRHKFAL